MWQQTAALRDFDPAYDRLGSFASEAIRAGEQRMSALCRFCCRSRRSKTKASDGFSWNYPVSIRSIESGEDAAILATAAVMQHTKHRLVVVEQPV